MNTIEVSRDGKVGLITLNRPQRLNAYTPQMGAEIFSALHEFDRDDAVRVAVVTGAGRGFCAGADLEAGGTTFAGDRTWEDAGRVEAKVRPWNMRIPVIAAINGPAVGIGATLPLLWDMRFAAESARIGFVFTRRGIIPEANSTWILPRVVGVAKALDLLITGRIVSAREALELGLVSRVLPDQGFLDAVLEVARDIAVNTAPVSVALVKRLVWRQLMQTDPRLSKQLEDELFYWVGKQPDAAEGVNSFIEKRAAEFSMSANQLPPVIADLEE